MAERGGDDIAALCRLAAGALRARGHELEEWYADSDDPAVALTGVCRRCGLTVHVRTEGGLRGLAGPALTTSCAPPLRPA